MEEKKEFKYQILNYKKEYEERWDYFVMNSSVNGTFLQTRRFLNYHPVDRFVDFSLLVLDQKGNITAVCPGCIQYENNEKVFFSHKGSTFGGIVIGNKAYSAEKVIEIIRCIEKFLGVNGFNKIIYKITPSIFCSESADLLEYVLYYENYEEEKELNLQIEFADYKEDVMDNFSQMKRRNIHRCEKVGLQFKPLKTKKEIEYFHEVLSINLGKYFLKPVHSVSELMLLKNEVLKEECEFFGIFIDNDLIAGALMFYFNNVKVAHAQYLCALPDYNKLSPLTYMYYRLIIEMKGKGFQKLSWGIASEHGGKVLNMGLTQNKEAFGSKHSINRVYLKKLTAQ